DIARERQRLRLGGKEQQEYRHGWHGVSSRSEWDLWDQWDVWDSYESHTSHWSHRSHSSFYGRVTQVRNVLLITSGFRSALWRAWSIVFLSSFSPGRKPSSS